MDEQLWSTAKPKRVERLLIACVVYFILVRLFFIVSIGHIPNVTATYLIPMFILTGTIVWMRKGWPRSAEMILLIAFTVWLALTRILNGDKYLHESYVYVAMIGFAGLVLYPLPSVLGDKARKRYFATVALLFSFVMGIAAWVGVVAVVAQSPISNPFNEHMLGLYENSRLWLFTAHPNGFSCLLYIALSMLLYLSVIFRRLWVRVWFAVLSIGICLAIYFTGSTSSIVITVFILLAAAFLLIIQNKKISKKRLMMIISAAILLIVIFAGTLVFYYSSTSKGDVQTGTEEVFTTRFGAAPNTFASRVRIWQSGFQLLQDKPLRFLIGDLRTPVRQQIAEKMGEYLTHMHNSYMEVLMTSGIPAALLMIAFNLLLLYRCGKLFFSKQAPLTMKLLTLPLVGLMIHAAMENFIFTEELQSMLFFLLAGMVVPASRALRPAKKERVTVS